MSKVKIRYANCPNCHQPHDRREVCGQATKEEEVAVGTIRARARRRRGPKYRFKLSKEQRREIFAGRSPRVTVPKGQSPFVPGDVYHVPGSANLWLGFTGISEGKDEDELIYVLHDDNPRLLRARVHGVDFEAIRRSFDGRGRPQPLSNAEAVAQAAEESAYTKSSGAALTGEGEAVSREVQEQLTEESKSDRRIRRGQKRALLEAQIREMQEDPDFSEESGDLRYMSNKLQRWEEEDRAEEGAER